MPNLDESRIKSASFSRWRDAEYERRLEFDRRVFRTAATIVVEPDGNPLRTIITGGKRIYTGIFQSRKTGRSNPWESRDVEWPSMMEAEVRTDVKWWLAQPLRFEFQDGPEKLIYFPDQARRVLEGSLWRVIILEFKKSKEEVSKDPEYKRKLEIFEEVCAGIRWRFDIVEKADLGPPTYRRNVVTICNDRRTQFDMRDVDTLRAIACHGAFSYGAACEALGGYLIGKKKLHALMVKRIAAIPLDRVICRDTLVSLVDRSVEPVGGDGLLD